MHLQLPHLATALCSHAAAPHAQKGQTDADGSDAALVTPRGVLARTALAASTTFAAASLTYPLDIVRKRLIVDAGGEAPQYGGRFRTAVARIYAAEGLRGFYRFYGYDMVFRSGGGFGRIASAWTAGAAAQRSGTGLRPCLSSASAGSRRKRACFPALLPNAAGLAAASCWWATTCCGSTRGGGMAASGASTCSGWEGWGCIDRGREFIPSLAPEPP